MLDTRWVLKLDRPDDGICLANCASSLKTKYLGKIKAKTTAKSISVKTKKVKEYATRHASNGGCACYQKLWARYQMFGAVHMCVYQIYYAGCQIFGAGYQTYCARYQKCWAIYQIFGALNCILDIFYQNFYIVLHGYQRRYIYCNVPYTRYIYCDRFSQL